MTVKTLACCLGAVGWVLFMPLAAIAARLSLTGRVSLSTTTPVANARLTITFHGHETGIHEYTTQRQIRAQTGERGEFAAVVKVPDDRYIWTHAIIEIAETDGSKAATAIARCTIDDQGGGHCYKEFQVNPLVAP